MPPKSATSTNVNMSYRRFEHLLEGATLVHGCIPMVQQLLNRDVSGISAAEKGMLDNAAKKIQEWKTRYEQIEREEGSI